MAGQRRGGGGGAECSVNPNALVLMTGHVSASGENSRQKTPNTGVGNLLYAPHAPTAGGLGGLGPTGQAKQALTTRLGTDPPSGQHSWLGPSWPLAGAGDDAGAGVTANQGSQIVAWAFHSRGG